MALSANEWAAQIAKQVGQGVAYYRTQSRDARGGKLTAQALADRCAGLGLPLDRTVIAKLEKGTRQTITIGELLVLARALEIPPVLLLFPLGRTDTTEVLPGEDTDTWAALKWFTGEDDQFPGAVTGTDEKQDAEPVRLFREHERLIKQWWDNRGKLMSLIAPKDPELKKFRAEADPDAVDDLWVQVAKDTMRNAEEALMAIRSEMRDRGLTPPRLGLESAYIEPETFESTTLDELAQTVSRNKRISLSEAIREVYRIAGEPLPESQKDDTEGEKE
ncbi:hypothetical protein [Streptomyces flaveus]|uniref:HTH cro/C1-type domain-containing protein n=1 Tax=Streptomyces flaveus TaxID=66370 RepID=A0A917QRE7_9ACTN|nr:hypothetical protein [Streptomyces flaveus]GGK65431.1 hypothetical protein GCM10010094_28070 [Streptomyces flaveus]